MAPSRWREGLAGRYFVNKLPAADTVGEYNREVRMYAHTPLSSITKGSFWWVHFGSGWRGTRVDLEGRSEFSAGEIQSDGPAMLITSLGCLSL
jgi:hypothetical protein